MLKLRTKNNNNNNTHFKPVTAGLTFNRPRWTRKALGTWVSASSTFSNTCCSSPSDTDKTFQVTCLPQVIYTLPTQQSHACHRSHTYCPQSHACRRSRTYCPPNSHMPAAGHVHTAHPTVTCLPQVTYTLPTLQSHACRRSHTYCPPNSHMPATGHVHTAHPTVTCLPQVTYILPTQQSHGCLSNILQILHT